MAAGQVPLAEVSHIHGIAFDPAAPGTVFLATHYGLFKASPDGMAEAISENKDDYMGFSPHPTDPALLFASGHPAQGGNVGVITSRDGGATWTRMAMGAGGPVDFHAMTVSRADPRTLYGLANGIQVSRDGGVTWSIAGPGPDKAIDLAASAAKAEIVYAATLNGLMESSDAGTSWQLIGPPNAQVSMVEATPDGSLYAFFVGSGLFRRSPGDGTWAALTSDFGDKIILHLAADPADPAHLVAVTQESAILQSVDGGKTWAVFAK
ncbi:MAG: WD40/YVTN/BNR-like repeat-containing protein [Devosia sp.]